MDQMDRTGYNLGWETQWEDMKRYGPFARHLRRLMVEMLRPLAFETVLDVGCGPGDSLSALLKEFPHIRPCGVEISQVAIDQAIAKVPEGEFWLMDISEKTLEQKFDLVICSEVLEHISRDETAILHLAQMTRKYLLISVPQGEMRSWEKNIGHVRNYAYGEMAKKLEAAGLQIACTVQWGFPFYSPLYRDLINLVGDKSTVGNYGFARKLVANLMYLLYFFNSSRKGDELIILAEVPLGRLGESDGL